MNLRTFQHELLKLFTSEQVREQFLQSTGTEYATFESIEALPKAPVVIYATLLKSTADGVMSSIFPALRHYFDEKEWTNLIETYLQKHPSSNYRLNAIAENFSRYLEDSAPDKPWLAEIADYEYQELVVEENETEPTFTHEFTPLMSQTEVMIFHPVINATLCHRHYSFDVVEAVDSILNKEQSALAPLKQSTIVVFFRDSQTHRCRQLKLGKTAESVLVAALQKQNTYAQILGACLIANESTAAIEDRLSELLAIVNDFHEANLFTGNVMSVSSGS